jgi:ribosomal protein L23
MGRLAKRGLDFFSIDIDQEDNLTLVEAKHKIAGYGTVVKLWKKCYELQGYYADWEDNNIYVFAMQIGVEIPFLKEVVETCFEVEIFNREKYEKHHILTSRGIQKRWKKVVVDAKRKLVEIDPEFDLLSDSKNLLPFTPEEIPVSPPENALNKNKVNKEINKEKREEEILEPQGDTFWKREQNSFLTNPVFLEQFCVARRLPVAVVQDLQKHFVQDLVLKDDVKDAKELQRHFVNWFTRCQQNGTIDQQGNIKNATPPEQSQTARNVIEERTNYILDQIG